MAQSALVKSLRACRLVDRSLSSKMLTEVLMGPNWRLVVEFAVRVAPLGSSISSGWGSAVGVGRLVTSDWR